MLGAYVDLTKLFYIVMGRDMVKQKGNMGSFETQLVVVNQTMATSTFRCWL